MKRKKKITQNIPAMMVTGIGLIVVGIAAFFLLKPAASKTQDGIPVSSVVPAGVNYPVPGLTLDDLEGNQHSLSDYLGQVVLVNMWASWCPPCVAELPTLNDFHIDHTGEGFVIIGINDGEEFQVVKEYVDTKGFVFPIWLDPTWLSERAFKTTNLPSSFVIDRNGQVRLQWVGAISRAMLDQYVLPIIME